MESLALFAKFLLNRRYQEDAIDGLHFRTTAIFFIAVALAIFTQEYGGNAINAGRRPNGRAHGLNTRNNTASSRAPIMCRATSVSVNLTIVTRSITRSSTIRSTEKLKKPKTHKMRSDSVAAIRTHLSSVSYQFALHDLEKFQSNDR